jgi:hypothetical protein
MARSSAKSKSAAPSIQVDSDAYPNPPSNHARISAIVQYVQGRGSDASDLRDAAHEAYHAIYAHAKRWDRESIHKALCKRIRKNWGRGEYYRSELIRQELRARAVEWIVCETLGVEYDLDKWADSVFWEAAKNMKILLPHDSQIADGIKRFKEHPSVKRAAQEILDLDA